MVRGRNDEGTSDAVRRLAHHPPHAVHRRCALSSAISKDEGRTFEHLRHIARDPEDDFGYQCVEFLDDGLVLVGYHARDGLHVARIGVDWFYEK